MTPEDLRISIINGIDHLLNLPNWVVNADQKRVLQAQRKFWVADDAPLAKLLSLYQEDQP